MLYVYLGFNICLFLFVLCVSGPMEVGFRSCLLKLIWILGSLESFLSSPNSGLLNLPFMDW
uniref:Uncharacterized protein n=1 Tax=Rhizophora mucronata TaxID=61149 RepID=A0A2P2K131_RHIMU